METISVRVPVELKAQMKKYRIKPGEIARKAWEAEIQRRELELEEAREAADSLGEFFSKIPKCQILKWIREDRDTH